jgi:hypothetical protein
LAFLSIVKGASLVLQSSTRSRQAVRDGLRAIRGTGPIISVVSSYQGETIKAALDAALGQLNDDQKTQQLGAILAVAGGCLGLAGAILATL